MTLDRRHNKYDSGIVIAVITIVIGFMGYCGDNAYKGILSSISDSKAESISHYKNIYQKINAFADKEAIDIKCLDNDFAKCGGCRSSEVC